METFYAESKHILLNGLLEIEDQNEVIHAFASLRIKPGEYVEVINGNGVRFSCKVIECTKKKLSVLPLKQIISDPDYNDIRLTVAVSVLNKNSKMKLLVEKLTEIGIYEFIPFISDRTAFPKMKADSLKPSMVSALKQCGGNTDVKLSETITFKELLNKDGFDGKYFADINGQNADSSKFKGKILAVVGPEGGLTEPETELLLKNGFSGIRLNKRILRAETAAIITASKFLY